jgi:MFS family permease
VRRSPLLPIFLIVLVDVLGFTIVIPLLGFYAERFGASPLVATTLVSVYAVCSLISTPIIGKLSDRIGRRRMLLFSQAGTCLGFLMLAWSHSLWMVFVGRILDGITAGNLSLAQAYISDHTKPENRTKAFGVIGVAFGIGFMIGPGLGGTLGKYGLYLPFLVAACLSLLSMFATFTMLSNETPGAVGDGATIPTAVAVPAGPGGKRPGAFDISTYLAYFRRPGLGGLYLQFFLFAFTFSSFMSGFALFAERRFTVERHLTHKASTCTLTPDEKLQLPGAKMGTLRIGDETLVYGTQWEIVSSTSIEVKGDACARLDAAPIKARVPWTAHEVGLLFVFSGVLGILLQGGLIGRLARKYGEARLVIVGFLSSSAAAVTLGFSYTLAMLVVVAVMWSFGSGVTRPSITTRITQVAGRAEQGVAIGISGSLSSFAMMLAPPTGGLLLDHHWTLAWALVPATTAMLGCLVALALRRSSPGGANPESARPVDELSSAP